MYEVAHTGDLHPRTALRAAENCLDHLHSGQRVSNGRGHLSIVEDRLGEKITLDGVLVAGLQRNALDLVTVLVGENAGLIGWSVEWDFDLDATMCAENIHPLIGRDLSPAGKGRGAGPKVQNSRCKPINLKGGIVLNDAKDAPRLRAEEKAGQRNGVTADIQHPA